MMDSQEPSIESIWNKVDEFISMSNISEIDIQDIYRKSGENILSQKDLAKIEYSWDIPLYQKMIFRLRNEKGNVVTFWSGCDPINQYKLLSHYSIPQHGIRSPEMDFFLWMSCSLGRHDIEAIGGDILQWQKNPIEFFFGLDAGVARKLVERYARMK